MDGYSHFRKNTIQGTPSLSLFLIGVLPLLSFGEQFVLDSVNGFFFLPFHWLLFARRHRTKLTLALKRECLGR